MTLHHLDGRRILVAEDELMIALMVETSLREQGCQVVGPFARVDDALTAANAEQLDGALLDINLNGDRIFPVADTLAARRVPFLLVSGYGADVLPPNGRHWRVCTKPFRMAPVLTLLDDIIGGSHAAAEPGRSGA